MENKSTIFTDSEKREWDLKLTLGTARMISTSGIDSRITEMSVNLLRGDRELVEELVSNRELVLTLAWLICKGQSQAHGVADEDAWCNGLDAVAIADCERAFWQSFVNFSPSLATYITSVRTLQTEMVEEAASQIATRKPDLLESAKRTMDRGIDAMMSVETG